MQIRPILFFLELPNTPRKLKMILAIFEISGGQKHQVV